MPAPVLKPPQSWMPPDEPYWVRVLKRVATVTGTPDPGQVAQVVVQKFPRLGQYMQRQAQNDPSSVH